MTFKIFLHRDVKKYLRGLDEDQKERCYGRLKECLKENPFRRRAKCDIKALKGQSKNAYRLRVGDHRFKYVVEDKEVKVVEAFNRERGYR